jgi:predicted SnoaL-like aldol condensation-catalyzing enzyme
VPEPGVFERAIVDIFRIENEKLVEHWDVVQPIPEKSVNKHPMF